MQKITIEILGEPRPKQSARFRIVKSKGKSFVSSYQTKEVKDNGKAISEIARLQLGVDFRPLDGFIEANVAYVFSLPKSASKEEIKMVKDGYLIRKNTKPDVSDNLSKQLMDSLEGILFTNDSRICSIYAAKYYGQIPKTILTVYEVDKYVK